MTYTIYIHAHLLNYAKNKIIIFDNNLKLHAIKLNKFIVGIPA